MVQKYETIFCMSWFNKAATIEEPSALTLAEQLAEIEEQYRTSERAFDRAHRMLFDHAKTHPDGRSVFLNGNLFARIAAMKADPERAKLEVAQAHALTRRNSLLAARAALLKSLGVIR